MTTQDQLASQSTAQPGGFWGFLNTALATGKSIYDTAKGNNATRPSDQTGVQQAKPRPAWLIPVLIGGAVLAVLFFVFRKK